MARVTIEDCLKKVPSRFKLVHLAIERVKQLKEGAEPLLQADNKEIVLSLREIAAGLVNFENIKQLGKKEKTTSPYELAEILKQRGSSK
ncbi:DNA-directed RNA polymerase subunit omega [Thermodesulfobacterium sp. TA1]|uniref:DNA-directed RNA polymerase subunit omega n=1 Tax=Thermodesulfobacterium sp. TA1 TaxID=2234087 RepID=UPI0012329DEE|nr:DNA-directed RNA polymerase subunit omega [Thermodesulfobacterium sp. TA1]QER41539.1 DNA-directed RNA polymerase subunit omega [Thermodesulfobacterium sp. TA1]